MKKGNAYTKKKQVGRSYDDEKPQHESPFDRDGIDYEKSNADLQEAYENSPHFGKGFPKSPTPPDISPNGLDSIKKPPFGESPKPDPTDGQAVEFDPDIEEGYTDLEERLENAMRPPKDRD